MACGWQANGSWHHHDIMDHHVIIMAMVLFFVVHLCQPGNSICKYSLLGWRWLQDFVRNPSLCCRMVMRQCGSQGSRTDNMSYLATHKCVDTVLVSAIWKEKDAVGIGYRDADTARPAGNMRRNIRSCAICLRLRLRTYSHKCLRPACIFFTFDWHWTWRRAPRALLYLAFGVPYYIRYSLAVNLIETYWQVLPALHAAHILPRDSDLGPFGLSVSLHFSFNGFSFL